MHCIQCCCEQLRFLVYSFFVCGTCGIPSNVHINIEFWLNFCRMDKNMRLRFIPPLHFAAPVIKKTVVVVANAITIFFDYVSESTVCDSCLFSIQFVSSRIAFRLDLHFAGFHVIVYIYIYCSGSDVLIQMNPWIGRTFAFITCALHTHAHAFENSRLHLYRHLCVLFLVKCFSFFSQCDDYLASKLPINQFE